MVGIEGFAAFAAGWSPQYRVPLSSLPAEYFTPSAELDQSSWPDFGARSLADWESSTSPAPDVPRDCCLALCSTRVTPVAADAANWSFIVHETGGIWDERKRLAVRRLDLGERGVAVIHAVARAMAHSNRSAEYAKFDELTEYRNLLNQFGLDCNQHIQAMAEGFYPIDLTEEALALLGVEGTPCALEIEWEDHTICFGILAPNSSDW